MTDTPEAILDRLIDLDWTIQPQCAAVFLLEIERDELRVKFRLLGWTPPTPKAAA